MVVCSQVVVSRQKPLTFPTLNSTTVFYDYIGAIAEGYLIIFFFFHFLRLLNLKF